jgi:hypothetical protein
LWKAVKKQDLIRESWRGLLNQRLKEGPSVSLTSNEGWPNIKEPNSGDKFVKSFGERRKTLYKEDGEEKTGS